MPSLEHAMPLSRPRDKGSKPVRPGNRPDKHRRAVCGGRASAKKSGVGETSQRECPTRGGECKIDGVTYLYDDLPYSAIHLDGKPPEQVIREMSPEARGRFGIVALVPDAAAEVLAGVRKEIVETLKSDDSVEEGTPENVNGKTAAPKKKSAPNISPERTLEEVRKELLNLLLRAREKASKVDVVKRRVRGKRGERMEVERRGVLPKGDRIRLRVLKGEYRKRLLSEEGVLLPPAMGSSAWFEVLEARLAA